MIGQLLNMAMETDTKGGRGSSPRRQAPAIGDVGVPDVDTANLVKQEEMLRTTEALIH